MIAQVLDAPRKREKTLITNQVTTAFSRFLCTSVTYTPKRISISRFGILKMFQLSRKTLNRQKMKAVFSDNHADLFIKICRESG